MIKNVLKELQFEVPEKKVEYFEELNTYDGIVKMEVKALSNLLK